MTARPLVSIGVPTYNRVDRLERSIELMLAQDYSDIEVVVSDNASTDGTRDFCEALARRDPRVRYYRQPRNLGPIANYQEVLRLATGEFYMNLADDDDLDPTYVSTCVSTLLADPGLMLACGRALMYQDGGFVREAARTNLLDDSPSKRLLRYYETVVENVAFHGVIRRSILSSLPPMRNDVMAGDWLFMASVAFSGRMTTTASTSVVKHLGGASVSMVSIARTFGLGPMHARYWIENVILAVFRDIAWESPVYAPLGRRGRLALASAAVAVLVKRYRARWQSGRYFLMALSDALLPVDVKRELIALRNELWHR